MFLFVFFYTFLIDCRNARIFHKSQVQPDFFLRKFQMTVHKILKTLSMHFWLASIQWSLWHH